MVHWCIIYSEVQTGTPFLSLGLTFGVDVSRKLIQIGRGLRFENGVPLLKSMFTLGKIVARPEKVSYFGKRFISKNGSLFG